MKKRHFFFLALCVICLGSSLLLGDESSESALPQGVLTLPEHVRVELISPERGMQMVGEAGRQAKLPQGQYRLESWTLVKQDDAGRTWHLTGDVNTARMVEIGPEPTTLEIKTEPIVCDLKIHPYDNAMNFTLGLKGPSGERLRISGDAPGVKSDQLPQPTFVLYNADKSFEKSYGFKSQCCGNFRFRWIPPADVQGPFFVDVKVAGPFTTDFEPVNISEAHEAKIAEQQVAHKKEIRLYWLIGFCYTAVLAVIIGILIKCRKAISAEGQAGRRKRVIRWLTAALGVLGVLMLLNPLTSAALDNYDFSEALADCGLFAVVLLILAVIVWGVRKVRTKWPFVTIVLYSFIFAILLVPVLMAVFMVNGHDQTKVSDFELDDFAGFYGGLFSFDDFYVFVAWGIVLAILVAQVSLLLVPVRIKHQRPKARRGIWFTAIVAALLYTGLLFMLAMSVMAVIWKDNPNEIFFWVVIGILPLNWIGWSVVFGLFSRNMEPESYIRRLTGWLIGGSILELLIAVPSHIIIRHREVCCAHGLTAAGLTTGLAVIFLAFGPGLYFLYADRIRSRKPNLPESVPET